MLDNTGRQRRFYLIFLFSATSLCNKRDIPRGAHLRYDYTRSIISENIGELSRFPLILYTPRNIQDPLLFSIIPNFISIISLYLQFNLQLNISLINTTTQRACRPMILSDTLFLVAWATRSRSSRISRPVLPDLPFRTPQKTRFRRKGVSAHGHSTVDITSLARTSARRPSFPQPYTFFAELATRNAINLPTLPLVTFPVARNNDIAKPWFV